MNTPQKALLTSRYDHQNGAEQEGFNLRNKVAQTYKGPVFVVEDVWVPCSRCRTPVDPVVRIPVGKMWFHPQCLRCVVCEKPSRTQIFHAVHDQPVCVDCVNRGFAKTVPKLSRSQIESLPRLAARSVSPRPAIACYTPDPRSTTRKQLQLMERQQMSAVVDRNILLLMAPPDASAVMKPIPSSK
jgi:hypothetical protein